MRESVQRLLIIFAFLMMALNSSAAPQWNQQVNGFMDGRQIPLFWVGSNWTSLCFGDTDLDGDQDLLVGSYYWVAYFRNDGTASDACYTLVTEDLLGTGVASADYAYAPTLGDVDGDGDMDLVVGSSTSAGGPGFEFFRNTGTAANPQWQEQSASFLPSGGHYTRPQLVDLDADGLLDLIVGKGDPARLYFYRNTGTATNPILTSSMSVSVTPAAELGLSYTYSCCPALADVDGDGDRDLFLGFMRDDGSPGGFFVWFYRNTGTAQTPSFQKEDALLSGLGHQNTCAWNPALVDIDGDGDQDFFAAEQSGRVHSWENTGTTGLPQFQTSARSYFMDSLSISKPAFSDLDDDGDLDMLLGGNFGQETRAPFATMMHYENVGTPLAPRWRLVSERYADIALHPVEPNYCYFAAHPTFADFDGDGLDELYVTQASGGRIEQYLNTGTKQNPAWTLQSSQWQGIEIGNGHWPGYRFGNVTFADLNGDHDQDLIVGYGGLPDGGGYRVYYCENEGGSLAAAVDIVNTNAQNQIALPYTGMETMGPAFSDLDRDGDLDLVLGVGGHRGSPYEGQLNYFENVGTAQSHDFVLRAANYIPGSNMHVCDAPVFADINGDGNDDLFVGGFAGGLRCYYNEDARLTVSPRSHTLVAGTSATFQASEGSGSISWTILENRSGAPSLTPSGVSASYTAGTVTGVTDVIQAKDESGVRGLVYVNVISSSQVSASGKAILMAGRKAGDSLWPTTNSLAHFIYRTLLYRGFSKDNVQYLNPQTGQDADGDGNHVNDIDAASSLASIDNALTSFAANSPNLFVYLIDHGEADPSGNNGYIRCNETEILTAVHLDELLDDLQANHGVNRVTLVVDCCTAGSFLSTCSGAPAGKERVIVCSASPTQPAFFSAQGLISFTNAFVTALYSGLSIGDGFTLASGAMNRYQQPCMDDDGDGIFSHDVDGALARTITLGASFIAGADRPQIGAVSSNQTLAGGASSAQIWASNIASVYPIDHVWATIAAPNFIPESQIDPTQPVTNLPQIELTWDSTDKRYEGSASGLTELGAYAVNIYAKDIWGGVAYPKQTFLNQTQSDEKLIIVCGDGDYDANSPWSAPDALADAVYETGAARWLTPAQIIYLSSSTDARVDDGPPTRAKLQSAISSCAGVSKLTVYFLGRGDAAGFDIDGDGADADDVTPANVDAWLDALQGTESSQRQMVAIDCSQSGAWLPSLAAPAGKARIVVSSCAAAQSSWCEEGGMLSFTRFFFSQIFSGLNVRDSFTYARLAMRGVTAETQNPQLDDNGSGHSNWQDGTNAQSYYLGAAFVTAADEPTIGVYANNVDLSGSTELLWAANVTAPKGIAEVFAYVVRPGASPTVDSIDKVALAFNSATGRWEATYANFDPAHAYPVIYLARSLDGTLSQPYRTVYGTEQQTLTSEDLYDRLYEDETPATLNIFGRAESSQTHNFWHQNDIDWTIFYVEPNTWYSFKVYNQAANCNARLRLFAPSDLITPLATGDDEGPGMGDEIISWFSDTRSGPVYLAVDQSPDSPSLFGENTEYELSIAVDGGSSAGLATISGTGSGYAETNVGIDLTVPNTVSVNGEIVPCIYTKHRIEIAPYTLAQRAEVLIEAPKDIAAPECSTQSVVEWLDAHPQNASMLCLRVENPVNLSSPARLTLQFQDNYSATHGLVEDVFYLDDIPDGALASSTRIHQWNGTDWEIVPGEQTVTDDTVSVEIYTLSQTVYAVAPVDLSSVKDWVKF